MRLQSDSTSNSEKIEELRTMLNQLRSEKDSFRELFNRYNSNDLGIKRNENGDSL